jgi:hypothetical protein
MTNVGGEVIAWNGLSHRCWTRRNTWNSARKLPTPPMSQQLQLRRAKHTTIRLSRPGRADRPALMIAIGTAAFILRRKTTT